MRLKTFRYSMYYFYFKIEMSTIFNRRCFSIEMSFDSFFSSLIFIMAHYYESRPMNISTLSAHMAVLWHWLNADIYIQNTFENRYYWISYTSKCIENRLLNYSCSIFNILSLNRFEDGTCTRQNIKWFIQLKQIFTSALLNSLFREFFVFFI